MTNGEKDSLLGQTVLLPELGQFFGGLVFFGHPLFLFSSLVLFGRATCSSVPDVGTTPQIKDLNPLLDRYVGPRWVIHNLYIIFIRHTHRYVSLLVTGSRGLTLIDHQMTITQTSAAART